MKLDFFMLADEVEATEDGKVDIRGGAINRVNVPDLPGTIAGLAVISAIIIAFLVELARGHNGNPYGWLGAIAGLAYLAAIVIFRIRG